MKVIVLALAVLLASVSAWPQTKVEELNSKDLVADVIVSLIEEYSRLVRDRGLDPYRLDYISGSYALPVAGLFSVAGSVSNVALDGISVVAVNRVSFNNNNGVLSFDVAYPYVKGSVGAASGSVDILDFGLAAEGSGSLEISNLRVAGTATLGVSLVDGITINAANVVLSVGSVTSNLSIVTSGLGDISDVVNNALSVTIPQALETYQSEISIVIEYVAIYVISGLL